ncbi:uncharacterized protein LOC118765448 [Octopus sinensis]|uniref:Uncharacterized protein LOC118765448 n=1 Tax=Octopus sinensis TaxID=2607531 RepID=A0A7E6F917_9MOLL|nr:uncharacterized protein LOC118765448 [Octopus sinensis]
MALPRAMVRLSYQKSQAPSWASLDATVMRTANDHKNFTVNGPATPNISNTTDQKKWFTDKFRYLRILYHSATEVVTLPFTAASRVWESAKESQTAMSQIRHLPLAQGQKA